MKTMVPGLLGCLHQTRELWSVVGPQRPTESPEQAEEALPHLSGTQLTWAPTHSSRKPMLHIFAKLTAQCPRPAPPPATEPATDGPESLQWKLMESDYPHTSFQP